MSQHIAGPWRGYWSNNPEAVIQQLEVFAADGTLVCSLPGPPSAVVSATADLIILAPELMESLIAITNRYVEVVRKYGPYSDTNPERETEVQDARDAIARASGETL